MKLRLPIRTRLTIWFFCVFSVALLVMGFVSLWMLHLGMVALENRELHERVRGVERFLSVRPPQEPLASLQSAMQVYNVTHGGKWLQVVNAQGQWLYRSAHIAPLYPALVLPRQLGNRRDYFDFKSGTRHVRALIRTIQVNGNAYTVQTGMTLNRRTAVLVDFRLHMLLLAPLLLLLAAIAGYIASRKALRPVALITEEANRINSRNLGTRLPVPDTQDELTDMSETLNRMLDRIDAGYRGMKEFTANAAHELRTPLSLIRAEAEIALVLDRNPEAYRDALSHIQSESVRMARLIDDLLALARTDAGVQPLQFQPLHAAEIMRLAAHRWSATLSQLDLHMSLEAEADCTILADQPSLERLLDILIENAMHYSPRGSSICLQVRYEDQNVVMSVIDSGPGIAPEHQERIFERFYRVSSANDGSPSAQGAGLGLALARWIADVHQARLEVRSALGNGTCFSLRMAAFTETTLPRQAS